MKQPVWILNSSLLVLFFISQLLLFMIQRVVPRRISISPGKMVVVQEQAVVPVDITRIYGERDLFNTYEAPIVPVRSVVDSTVAPMPAPPKIIIPEVPVEKTPTFFAPLDVVLKGVIFVKDDPASCIAIVQLKKTKEERNYQVGDLVEDAQILKILSNRIIIIRSNGQQETLYLREEDAISDFNTEAKSTPKSIVEDSSDGKYTINIDEFTKRVRNLGEFINLLDLTTVYKQGKSFGCRIGKIDKDSLGALLGFAIDDVIVKVDDYYVDDLAHRIQLYDHIVKKHVGDLIEVVLYRGQDMMTIMYGLVDNVSKSIVFTPQHTHQKLMEELSKHEAAMQQKVVASKPPVVIQSMSQSEDSNENEIVDASPKPDDVDDMDMFDLNFDEKQWIDDTSKQKFTAPSNKIISAQVNKDSSETMQSVSPSAVNESDRYQNRLLQEYEKLSSTVQDIKSKDRSNMMKRSSRNVIFGGMQ